MLSVAPSDGSQASQPRPSKSRPIKSVTTSDFKWIKRLPSDFCQSLLDSGHTPDTHVYRETYHHSSDRKDVYVHGVLDFDTNTFKILKDVRTFEDIRLNDYHYGRAERPDSLGFPGVVASHGPPLSRDITPLRFIL